MKFKIAEREENYSVLKMVSEGGQWELGLWAVMFGVRVRFGRVGRGCVNLDYCAGADPQFQLDLFNAVRIILLKVPEDIECDTVEMLFPGYSMKPINLDATCWPELQAMRDKVKRELGITEDYLPIYDQNIPGDSVSTDCPLWGLEPHLRAFTDAFASAYRSTAVPGRLHGHQLREQLQG